MNRFYLDTNILAFMLTGKYDELADEVSDIISDYGNILMASSVAVHELLHLCQIEKLDDARRKRHVDAGKVLEWLDTSDIGLVCTNRYHLKTFARLPMIAGHHDPNDRLIIAQAISDRVPLVSSDREFVKYGMAGLEFVYNRR